MPELKKPQAVDIEKVQLIRAAPESVTLMPIFFNGQARLALVLPMVNNQGPYVRLLAILPVSEDVIENGLGQPASFTPPAGIKDKN